mgnify:CR=1 FL=1
MAYKQKGFTPFTQDKKGLTRYEQYQYYKNKEHITDARKEEQEKRFPTKDFGHIEPKMGYGPAEFIGGPVIKGIQGVKTGVKALKSSPKMQRILKAWSDKASKAFKAWKKDLGKKCGRKRKIYQQLVLVSSRKGIINGVVKCTKVLILKEPK